MEPEGDVAGQHGGVGGQRLGLAPDDSLGRGERDQRLLEQARPRLERPVELPLLAHDHAQDLVAPLREMRVRVRHRVDHHGRRLAQERLGPTEQAAVADGPAQDSPQDVAPALVRRQHPVADEERDRARVVGDHLVAEALLLEALRVVPQQLAHPGVDRREQVRVVVARDALDDARDPLEAQAGVDAGGRERREAPVRVELELHEHEVPDLEPARAVLAVVRDAVGAFGQVGAAVVVQLRARAAGADVGHPPPVLLVARREVAPAHEPLRRQPDLVLPDRVGEVVGGVDGRGEPLRRDLEVAGQELPRPVDRLALEVVAEAPVAEHLEQRVMARRPADLLEVVVLAGDPQAALVVHGPDVVPLLHPGQRVLELDHARVREQERLVARRDQAGAGDDGVAALGEEVHEPRPDLGRGQVGDRRLLGGARHRRNGSERGPRLRVPAAIRWDRLHGAGGAACCPRSPRRPAPRR